MYRNLVFILLPLFAGVAFAAASKEVGQKTEIAFFQDVVRKQWCAYRNGKAADAMIQKIGANNVGTLYYTGEHLARINYEEQNESGDSIISDDYFLDNDGRLARFERHTNTFHGNVSALEIYTVEDGKFRKVSTRYSDLTTRKPIRKPEEMDPQPGQPVRKNLKELPFYALLQNPAILVNARTCITRN